jgi:hypothetical protein
LYHFNGEKSRPTKRAGIGLEKTVFTGGKYEKLTQKLTKNKIFGLFWLLRQIPKIP